jgi:hypothetical protein
MSSCALQAVCRWFGSEGSTNFDALRREEAVRSTLRCLIGFAALAGVHRTPCAGEVAVHVEDANTPMIRICALAALGLVSLAPAEIAPVLPSAEALGTSASSFEQRAALAYHWAPLHHQVVEPRGSNGLSGRADQITRVDFDGDFRASNNWENASRFGMPGAVYQSVVETSSHWFIVFMFYHARDWAMSLLDTEHENDSEGMLLAIARDGSQFGRLKAAVTVAHSHFYSFLPKGSDWSAARESVDGVLELGQDGRPITTQAAQGHPFKAWSGGVGEHRIVYHPTRAADCPPPQRNADRAPYVLLDLFQAGGLWDLRADRALFASFGSFSGDGAGGCGSGGILCTINAANAPWGWDDGDDGAVRRGDIAMDPVKLVSHYFRIPEPVSRSYTYNPYLQSLRPVAQARHLADVR